MEHWQLEAIENTRELVVKYNHFGDVGRFDELSTLFAPDAVMELAPAGESVRSYQGWDEIRTIFTSTRDRWAGDALSDDRPAYVRHFVWTDHVVVATPGTARAESPYFVVMSTGLDHWGRYFDTTAPGPDGVWRFTTRRVTTDGRVPTTIHEHTEDKP